MTDLFSFTFVVNGHARHQTPKCTPSWLAQTTALFSSLLSIVTMGPHSLSKTGAHTTWSTWPRNRHSPTRLTLSTRWILNSCIVSEGSQSGLWSEEAIRELCQLGSKANTLDMHLAHGHRLEWSRLSKISLNSTNPFSPLCQSQEKNAPRQHKFIISG